MIKNQNGQAIIILLLILVVGLTIGISVVSRSLLNVKMSTQSDESSRAFTAAEAGIEVALEQDPDNSEPIEGTLEGNSKYECSKDIQGSGSSYIFYNVAKDKTVQLYFSDPNSIENQYYKGSKIRVMWGAYVQNYIPSSTTPALELTLLYETKSNNSYHIAKFVLDPNSSRTMNNFFCPPTIPINSSCASEPKIDNFRADGFDTIINSGVETRFLFGSNIDVTVYNNYSSTNNPAGNFLIFGRFRLLYNADSSTIGIKSVTECANCDFPSQGSVIDCLGSRDSGVSRRIKVYENYPATPELFDYVLFNGSQGSGLGH